MASLADVKPWTLPKKGQDMHNFKISDEDAKLLLKAVKLRESILRDRLNDESFVGYGDHDWAEELARLVDLRERLTKVTESKSRQTSSSSVPAAAFSESEN